MIVCGVRISFVCTRSNNFMTSWATDEGHMKNLSGEILDPSLRNFQTNAMKARNERIRSMYEDTDINRDLYPSTTLQKRLERDTARLSTVLEAKNKESELMGRLDLNQQVELKKQQAKLKGIREHREFVLHLLDLH
jgi:hypothetical protein